MSALVLITKRLRPSSQALLTEHGISFDEISFIKTETHISNPGLLKSRTLVMTDLVFTSRNAVSSLKGFKLPDSVRVHSLSGATFEALNDCGIQGKVGEVADNATELASKLVAAGIKTVDFFCGDKRLDTLPGTLKQAGVEVFEHPVYNTVLTPQTLNQHYSAMVFFSPSAVESFLKLNAMDPRIKVIAIGETTAESLRDAGFMKPIVSAKPTEAEIINTLISTLKK